jgi:hypothetical protein
MQLLSTLNSKGLYLRRIVHGWSQTIKPDGPHPELKQKIYSLNAMTSYGQTNLNLEDHWHLMGVLRGAQWIAAVRADHCFSVRHDGEILAVRQ